MRVFASDQVFRKAERTVPLVEYFCVLENTMGRNLVDSRQPPNRFPMHDIDHDMVVPRQLHPHFRFDFPRSLRACRDFTEVASQKNHVPVRLALGHDADHDGFGFVDAVGHRNIITDPSALRAPLIPNDPRGILARGGFERFTFYKK